MTTSLKQQVALAACQYAKQHPILGIGSGSTVNLFIEALAEIKADLEGCIPASVETERRLKEKGIPTLPLSAVTSIPLYIDSADEVNHYGEAIKGGGGALTREKILATASLQWICMIDESKFVSRLGSFPLAIEVLPMARSYVAREIVKLGGDPVYREGFVTDNQNQLLDVYHLDLGQPMAMEKTIKLIPGVVENGLFAHRAADIILIAKTSGIETITTHFD